jgi:hypothetical protein
LLESRIARPEFATREDSAVGNTVTDANAGRPHVAQIRVIANGQTRVVENAEHS